MPERCIRWADTIGPVTAAPSTGVLDAKCHPRQAYRPFLGNLHPANSDGEARFKPAARWAPTTDSLLANTAWKSSSYMAAGPRFTM